MARKFLIVVMLALVGSGAFGCLVLDFPHYEHEHHHHHYYDHHR